VTRSFSHYEQFIKDFHCGGMRVTRGVLCACGFYSDRRHLCAVGFLRECVDYYRRGPTYHQSASDINLHDFIAFPPTRSTTPTDITTAQAGAEIGIAFRNFLTSSQHNMHPAHLHPPETLSSHLQTTLLPPPSHRIKSHLIRLLTSPPLHLPP